MQNINRRNWIKASSALGLGALLQTSTLKGMGLSNLPPMDIADAPIRLSSNENPYGPSDYVRKAMIDNFNDVCRYPGMFYRELVDKLAKKHGVDRSNIILTAGSTEGLKMAGITYGGEGHNIVAADPVFLALQNYSAQFGTYIHKVPVTKNMTHDLSAMEQRVTQSTRLVYVCNPNNPTSALEPAKEIEAFCKTVSNRTVVFADEAYFDYITDPTYPTMIELVKKGMNVIVARTFSKVYGLAGIRIGYLIARPDIIQRIGKKSMAGPNVLAVAAAKAALEDKTFYDFSIQKNKAMIAATKQTLDNLSLEYVPTAGNFLFFKTGRNIADVQADYLKEGIKVGRPFPPLTDWCRISMGTEMQVEKLCAATKKIFG